MGELLRGAEGVGCRVGWRCIRLHLHRVVGGADAAVAQAAVALEGQPLGGEGLVAEEEVHEVDGAAVAGQHHAAFDQVLQLTDVAGPGVGEHGVDGAAGEAGDLAAVAAVELVQEVVHEHGDVLPAFAQRRHAHGQHVQAVVQVLAKAAGLHLAPEVEVGGGHHAHVHREGLGAAHALDLAGLQGAQQLALGGGAEDADFVEEEGAAMGALEAAGPGGQRAGVAALVDAEELALDQVVGDGGAVDGHERARRTGADAVQRLRQHLLAHAAFAQEEHGGLRLRGAAHHVAHRVEAGRDADDFQIVEQRAGTRGMHGKGCGHAQAEVVGAQAGEVRLGAGRAGFGPGFGRAADDDAVRRTLGAALDLAEHHRAAHEAADKPAGVTGLLPADGVAADAVELHMRLGLGAAVPVEFTQEVAHLLVELEVDLLDAGHTFEHVQLRADVDGVDGAVVAAELARQVGVVGAAVVAHAGDEAARLVQPQALDQLLAQHAHGAVVQQQHALVVEPDAAVAGVEVQPRDQLVGGLQGFAAVPVPAADGVEAVGVGRHGGGLRWELLAGSKSPLTPLFQRGEPIPRVAVLGVACFPPPLEKGAGGICLPPPFEKGGPGGICRCFSAGRGGDQPPIGLQGKHRL